jgi:hypothetical protein
MVKDSRETILETLYTKILDYYILIIESTLITPNTKSVLVNKKVHTKFSSLLPPLSLLTVQT